MEFELNIKGTPEELQRALGLLGDISETPQVSSSISDMTYAPESLLNDYLVGLSEEAKIVLFLIVDGTLNPADWRHPGVTDGELTAELGRPAFGVIGGLGRRWTAVIGGTNRSPFRKDREGEKGRYVINKELALQIQTGLDATRN